MVKELKMKSSSISAGKSHDALYYLEGYKTDVHRRELQKSLINLPSYVDSDAETFELDRDAIRKNIIAGLSMNNLSYEQSKDEVNIKQVTAANQTTLVLQ